jgi:hypothetical protein
MKVKMKYQMILVMVDHLTMKVMMTMITVMMMMMKM